MKLVVLPPYRNVKNFIPGEGHFMIRELVENMRKKGQLEGVEVDIDDTYLTEHTAETRDDEVLASITPGFLTRVRELSESGKYDAIACNGSIEPGFFAGRMISKIPITFALHSAVHVASLLGDRFAIIELTDPMGVILRRYVENFGLSHKLVSIRTLGRSSTNMMGFIKKYKKEERAKAPELKMVIDDIVARCITAIEKDRADSLILGCPPLQCLVDEIRQGLDEAGYGEIQLICEVSAAVEMAKAMVNMKLIQAPRAYPSDSLKAKPEFR